MRESQRKYVLAMVGLPARGKSYTARRLARYLRWLGYPTRVFNAGELRRTKLGAGQRAEFFDPDNTEGQRSLEAIANEALAELVRWLERAGSRVAIFDATNATRARRERIRKRCASNGFEIIFIELLNDDPDAILENVRAAKLSSPDYEGADPDEAERDFLRRIAHYARGYTSVEDDEGSYVKLIDRHRKIITHRIDGWIPARMIAFLTNLRITEKPVLIARHGESLYNRTGRIGGDAPLSERGREFARQLAGYVNGRFGAGELRVWTSRLRRAVETAETVGRSMREWNSLAEINAGICDGLTYDEIRALHPEVHAARARDKLRYRYPQGESYLDVIQRLDHVILELERQRVPVLVIAHQAVLRALYAYFADVEAEQIPYLTIPLHTLIELTPRAYGCAEQRIVLPPG